MSDAGLCDMDHTARCQFLVKLTLTLTFQATILVFLRPVGDLTLGH